MMFFHSRVCRGRTGRRKTEGISVDFEKLRQFITAHNAFAKKLNVTVEEIRPGYARVSKTVLADETNPAGTAHGGLFLTLTDIASGSAAAAHGHVAATVSEDYHYLRGALAGDKMTAEAREVKCGRTLCVFEVQITNQDGVLLGVGNCTYFIKDRLLPLE